MHRSILLLAPALLLAACDTASAPSEATSLLTSRAGGMTAHAAGGGVFDAGVPVQFSFSAGGFADGSAVGALHFSTDLGGLAIEFRGRVTCMAVDPGTNRAWIGGVVTANSSTHPGFTTAIHQVGKDIWFRVVDYGDGASGVADRTTFVGFEGGGGIQTSAEYCLLRIWPGPPDDVPDARTGPLLSGNLTVN
jgi:hypothetical protein